MKLYFIYLCILSFVIYMPSMVFPVDDVHDYSPIRYEREKFTGEMRISRGGQLYDNWWKTTVNTDKPEENHQLWQSQTNNKRSGYATYRCKECHGWDYRGKEGAYGKGSHYTGFKGVYDASQKMSVKELSSVLQGSAERDHDFSKILNGNDISDLALFLKYGIIDLDKFLNADGSPADGDINAGSDFFKRNCMTECHGPEGTSINFGSEEKPEFVGTLAAGNPWEFIHKVRAGQPGTRMPSGIINRWSDKDILDILSYSRRLPREKKKASWFDRVIGKLGFGEKPLKSHIPETYRGFGPKME